MRKPLIELRDLISKIKVTDTNAKEADFERALAQIVNTISLHAQKGNKIIIIGNGGSASIASHIATDLLKNIKIPALAFNDASLLTCLSNDLGYENVFSAPIEVLANKGDILFAISSSGKSNNILNAVAEGKRKGCFVVTFSGFLSSNPLKKMGNINFYVPSLSYGAVEIAHLAICHAVVDILYKK